MAVILTVTSTPSSFASGSFPLSTLQSGPAYRLTITPSLALSNAAYNGDVAILATNDNGGLYLHNRTIALFNGSGAGTLVVASAALTASAGQPITITVNLAAGTNASSLVVSGATTGNGTTAFTTSGTYFTATTLGVGQFTNSNTFVFTGTISNIDDTAPAGASGSASVGGITSTGSTIPGTFATGSANVGGISSSGAAASPGTAGGSASVGGITSTGTALTPAIATGAAAVGGITSTGQAGQSLFGTVGQTTATQRADQTGPSTGTMSTAFVSRTPSAAVAINDRLIFNGRRWHVNTAGTLGAGSGPTGTGLQADGTAQLVAMVSTDTALTMTTQTSNSVLIACVMRENWASDTSAPTSNKGGTFVLQGSAHFYTGFTSAASAVFAMANAPGGSGHTISLTWPAKSASGAEASMLVVEIPTGRSTSFVQAVSFVEVTSSSTETSASVTTTGPAMLVAFWLGAGNVLTPIGSEHPANAVAPFTRLLNADTSVSIHVNGYVQAKASAAFQAAPGTYTAQWSSVTEPAQLYLVAIQEAPGTSASGTSSVGGITSTGTTTSSTTVAASGSSAVGGITSTGATIPGTFAGGATSVGGVTSAGAVITGTFASGAAAVGGVASVGSASSAAAPSASGTAAVGGIAGAGVAAVAAFGAAAAGGIASVGAAITGTFATGTSAVGGIVSAGVATVPGTASGTTTVGGVTSAGVVLSPAVASGGASVGGIASSGIARPGTFAGGTAAVGGVGSVGVAVVLGSTASVGGITSAGDATSTSRDPILAIQDAIYAWVLATSGLDADHVIWKPDGTSGPSPAGTYIALALNGIDTVSRDWVTSRRLGDGSVAHAIEGTRHPKLELTCYVGASDGADAAKWILDRVLTLRVRPDVAVALRRAGVGMGNREPIQVVKGARSGMYDPMARTQIPLVIAISMGFAGGEFITAPVTVDPTL